MCDKSQLRTYYYYLYIDKNTFSSMCVRCDWFFYFWFLFIFRLCLGIYSIEKRFFLTEKMVCVLRRGVVTLDVD